MKEFDYQQAVRYALRAAFRAGETFRPIDGVIPLGIRRESGDPGKSGTFGVWRRDRRVANGIHCSEHSEGIAKVDLGNESVWWVRLELTS